MSLKNQGTFLPIPSGEAVMVGPDATTIARADGSIPNGLTDANFVSGGPYACGYGAFGEHPGAFDTGNADVTSAPPRKKPDYGGLGNG